MKITEIILSIVGIILFPIVAILSLLVEVWARLSDIYWNKILDNENPLLKDYIEKRIRKK